MTASRRTARLLLLLFVALWLWLTLPWLTGERSLVLRDVLFVHRHLKAFGASELLAGRIPAVNPTLGVGQSFRGNPNAAPFYPGNLFYLLLPFDSAFHLHFALHWLIGFLGLRLLARELGQSEEAAIFAALAWAGSGYFLTLLSFYNLIAVAAWAPLFLWGVARSTAPGVAVGGLACGLMLLGGEPLTSLMTIPFLLMIVLGRRDGRRWTRGVGAAAYAGALGLLIALPQIVATARVAPYSFRMAHGLESAEVAWQSLHPLRLLELLLPLPWGWPSDYARFGYWSNRVVPDIPFIYSIHFGVVALALAMCALRRRPLWAGFAALWLLLAMAAALAPLALAEWTGGIFRYPQRFVFGFTMAAALLAGWGLDAARELPRAGRRLAAAGVLLVATSVLLWWRFAAWAALLRDHLAEGGKMPLATTHAAAWIVAAAIAGLLLLASAWALRRRFVAAVVVLEAIGLLQLAPVLVTASTSELRAPSPFLAAMGDASQQRAVVSAIDYEPGWDPRPPYPIPLLNPVGQALVDRFNLQPAFGVGDGLSYPLAEDIDGLTTPLAVFLERNLQRATWSRRTPWLARVGARWVVRFGDEELPPLRRVAVERQFGVATELLELPDPAPLVRWPQAVVVAESPGQAFAMVASGAVPATTAVASREVAHVAGGTAALIERTPDRFAIDVDSGGGLLVVQTAYHPIWRARLDDGRELTTQPVDLFLLGVELPAGRHRLTVDISALPETLAGSIALVAALGGLLVAANGVKRSRSALLGSRLS